MEIRVTISIDDDAIKSLFNIKPQPETSPPKKTRRKAKVEEAPTPTPATDDVPTTATLTLPEVRETGRKFLNSYPVENFAELLASFGSTEGTLSTVPKDQLPMLNDKMLEMINVDA